MHSSNIMYCLAQNSKSFSLSRDFTILKKRSNYDKIQKISIPVTHMGLKQIKFGMVLFLLLIIIALVFLLYVKIHEAYKEKKRVATLTDRNRVQHELGHECSNHIIYIHSENGITEKELESVAMRFNAHIQKDEMKYIVDLQTKATSITELQRITSEVKKYHFVEAAYPKCFLKMIN